MILSVTLHTVVSDEEKEKEKNYNDQKTKNQVLKNANGVFRLNEDNADDENRQIKFRIYGSPMSESHRKYRCLVGSVITIEGTIGVGKTTLGKSLEKYLNDVCGLRAKFYPENVPQELLKLFISNIRSNTFSSSVGSDSLPNNDGIFPESIRSFDDDRFGTKNPYAFVIQLIMLQNRHQTYKEAFDEANKGTIVIVDRSLVGDYTFASMHKKDGNIDSKEWEADWKTRKKGGQS